MLRASDFSKKEIIDLTANEKLGYICDFEICTTTGDVSAIFVPNKSKKFRSGKEKTIRISWTDIIGIGDEIILVKLKENE